MRNTNDWFIYCLSFVLSLNSICLRFIDSVAVEIPAVYLYDNLFPQLFPFLHYIEKIMNRIYVFQFLIDQKYCSIVSSHIQWILFTYFDEEYTVLMIARLSCWYLKKCIIVRLLYTYVCNINLIPMLVCLTNNKSLGPITNDGAHS